jgi:hypothetical protein
MNFYRHRNQGARLSQQARSARTPSHRTGFFASLRAKGSGAPSLRLLAPLALVLAALLVLAAIPASALAARGHVFEGSFGTPGTGPGQLEEPTAVAVNEASHDVYVADTGNNRIDKFGLIANFLRAFLPGLRTGAAA